MSLTVARLHKALGSLVEAGHGRKPVCINKETFRHPCEMDGAVVLGVEAVVGPEWIGTADDDGGQKMNADGSESGRHVVILIGSDSPTSPELDRMVEKAWQRFEKALQTPTPAAAPQPQGKDSNER